MSLVLRAICKLSIILSAICKLSLILSTICKLSLVLSAICKLPLAVIVVCKLALVFTTESLLVCYLNLLQKNNIHNLSLKFSITIPYRFSLIRKSKCFEINFQLHFIVSTVRNEIMKKYSQSVRDLLFYLCTKTCYVPYLCRIWAIIDLHSFQSWGSKQVLAPYHPIKISLLPSIYISSLFPTASLAINISLECQIYQVLFLLYIP